MHIRKALFLLHLGVGLAAGAFLASMAASGILLAFAPQILSWSERAASRAASPEGPRQDLAALLSAATEADPRARAASLTLFRDPASSALVGLGESRAVHVDPHSGLVLGRGSRARGFFESVEHWHRRLGSRDIGKPFTGAAALGLVFLSLSGLWLWRPRGRAGFKASIALRAIPRGRARSFNRHNAIGFWASPFLLILALTGAVMAYRRAGNLLFTMTGSTAPKEEAGARGPGPAPENRGSAKPGGPDAGAMRPPPPHGNLHVSLDTLAARAGGLAPAWTSLTLRAPRRPGGPWSGTLQEPGFAAFPRRSQFSLDGETGSLSEWQPYGGQPTGRKLRAATRYLHTGRGFGWPGQALAAFAALALLSQIWTGFSMSWRRFAGRSAGARQGDAAGKERAGPTKTAC